MDGNEQGVCVYIYYNIHDTIHKINFFKSVSRYCILAKCVNVRWTQDIVRKQNNNSEAGEGQINLKMINYILIEKNQNLYNEIK